MFSFEPKNEWDTIRFEAEMYTDPQTEALSVQYIVEFSKKNGYEQNEVFRPILHHATILSLWWYPIQPHHSKIQTGKFGKNISNNYGWFSSKGKEKDTIEK